MNELALALDAIHPPLDLAMCKKAAAFRYQLWRRGKEVI
jgi:hypothetical protein